MEFKHKRACLTEQWTQWFFYTIVKISLFIGDNDLVVYITHLKQYPVIAIHISPPKLTSTTCATAFDFKTNGFFRIFWSQRPLWFIVLCWHNLVTHVWSRSTTWSGQLISCRYGAMGSRNYRSMVYRGITWVSAQSVYCLVIYRIQKEFTVISNSSIAFSTLFVSVFIVSWSHLFDVYDEEIKFCDFDKLMHEFVMFLLSFYHKL